MRVCVPQGLVGGFDHPTAGRLIARKGILNVPDDVARDLIKHDGCFPMADHPRGVGFVCGTCDFHGYFRTCGRCGNACHRPETKEA